MCAACGAGMSSFAGELLHSHTYRETPYSARFGGQLDAADADLRTSTPSSSPPVTRRELESQISNAQPLLTQFEQFALCDLCWPQMEVLFLEREVLDIRANQFSICRLNTICKILVMTSANFCASE